MNAIRTEIVTAANNNVEPYYSNIGNLMLRVGANRRTLMNGNKPTPLGQLFFDTKNEAPPKGWKYQANPYRLGRTELISTLTGERMTRRFNPATSVWMYSELGKVYYSTPRQEVTIHVPCTIFGTRADGSEYEYTGHMPLTREGIDEVYRPNGDMAALKTLVLEEFADNEMFKGNRIIHQASAEIWTYLPTGNWKVSTMNTSPNDGNPNVDVILQRPLGVSQIQTRLDHNLVIPEALEQRSDFTCVIRQMSVVLGKPEEILMTAFDVIQPFWRDSGITSDSILKYATENGITTTVLYNDKLLAKYNPPDRSHTKAMTFAIEKNHALFYRNPRVMISKDPIKKNSNESSATSK